MVQMRHKDSLVKIMVEDVELCAEIYDIINS